MLEQKIAAMEDWVVAMVLPEKATEETVAALQENLLQRGQESKIEGQLVLVRMRADLREARAAEWRAAAKAREDRRKEEERVRQVQKDELDRRRADEKKLADARLAAEQEYRRTQPKGTTVPEDVMEQLRAEAIEANKIEDPEARKAYLIAAKQRLLPNL